MHHNKTILNITQGKSPKNGTSKEKRKHLAFASNLVSTDLPGLNQFKN